MITAEKPTLAQDPAVQAFIKTQLSACGSIDDLDEHSNISYVSAAGQAAGLNNAQVAQAQEILLTEYMRSVGRC
jgi:hypothetical protein